MANKMELLDREIKYLLNKVKIWKPKQEATNQTTNSTAERTLEENEESAADSDIEKDKSAEEQPSDNLEEQQQESIMEADTTQDPVLLSESEEPQLPKEEIEEEMHQEL